MFLFHLVVLWLFSTPQDTHPIAQEALKKVGAPYVVASLENPNEDFVWREDAFDCFTLVEHCTAKVLSTRDDKPYLTWLEQNRYKKGKRNGYGSRQHYFLGWAQAGVEHGWLTAVEHPSQQPWKKKIDFMSTHKGAYPMHVPAKEWVAIQQQEKEISELETFYFPKETLPSDLSFIQTGDILAFTSRVPGLDVNHEAIAYWKNNQLHLIHASQERKKVILTEETLVAYVRRIKNHSGIMIYRLKL